MSYGAICKFQFSPFESFANLESLPTAASMTANQSQVFSQALDYYLGDGAKYIPKLYELANANTKEADKLILR
jgi:hypothetical protein